MISQINQLSSFMYKKEILQYIQQRVYMFFDQLYELLLLLVIT
jgi:hypothetical protein